MGSKKRERPKHLASKLLLIRKALNLSQSQIAKQLEVTTGIARISDWERGNREPDMIMVLRYARLAHVQMEMLVDDDRELIILARKRTRK